MSILDISNWTIDEINNSINTFKDTSLTDIGMVNCDIDSINIVGGITTATLWIDEDIGIDGYTGAAPLKIYKEDKIEIKLNSPLLEGDSIEVHDGKLCHYHKMGMVMLDGSEDEVFNDNLVSDTIMSFSYFTSNARSTFTYKAYCNNFRNIHSTEKTEHFYVEEWNNNNYFAFYVNSLKLSSQNKDGFKIWLQANPTTIVYQLIEPYYEDITPLQSSIILKTFNESSMTIDTNLPIKTNVSYRTNVPSISTLSNRVAEVSESDSVIQNLIDIIDDEVDE